MTIKGTDGSTDNKDSQIFQGKQKEGLLDLL